MRKKLVVMEAAGLDTGKYLNAIKVGVPGGTKCLLRINMVEVGRLRGLRLGTSDILSDVDFCKLQRMKSQEVQVAGRFWYSELNTQICRHLKSSDLPLFGLVTQENSGEVGYLIFQSIGLEGL